MKMNHASADVNFHPEYIKTIARMALTPYAGATSPGADKESKWHPKVISPCISVPIGARNQSSMEHCSHR